MADWVENYDKLMGEASELPYCVEAIGLIESAIKLSDSHNDDTRSFQARFRLVDEATYSGHPERALVAFGWLLGHCDDESNEYASEDVLWRYKWILSNMPEFSQISLKQINTSLEDFKQRLLDCGCSLKPYWSAVEGISRTVGDRERARDAFEEMKSCERDWMSDCATCVLDDEACYYAFFHDFEKALELSQPIVDGKKTCSTKPHTTYARMLLPAMAIDDWKRAKHFHETGYEMIWQSTQYLLEVGEHLEYLGCAQNLNAGFNIMLRHLPWYFESKSDIDRLKFLRGVVVLMDAFVEVASEDGSVTCAFPEELGLKSDGNEHNAKELRDFFEAKLMDFAKKLNKRNGNEYYSEDIALRRDFRAKFGPPELYNDSEADEGEDEEPQAEDQAQ